MNNYRFNNGLNWKATLKYDHSRGAMVYQSPMSIIDLKNEANKGVYNYMYRDIDGQTKSYDGQYVQTRMSCLNSGTIDEALHYRTQQEIQNFHLPPWRERVVLPY